MRDFEIKLDKVRKIRFTNSSIFAFEDASGDSFFNVYSSLLKGISIADAQKGIDPENISIDEINFPKHKTIVLLLWAGLQKHNDLSFEEVSDLCPMSRFHDVMPTVMEAMQSASEGGEEEKKSGEKAKKKDKKK